jgi:SAM-dependent methyltransferase
MLREMIWMVRHGRGKLRHNARQWGVDAAAWRRFWESYEKYRAMGPTDELTLHSLFPRLGDDTAETEIEPTYFYQDAWAFEKIVQNLPKEHVDVGSHHKFVALLSKVVPTTMVDIRPLSLPLNTLEFRKGSILEMPYEDGSVQSLSSLCVVEHIGLGRYGDPLDPKGTEKSVAELKRILAPGGNFYISVPIDDVNRTYFNAHRAFTEPYLEELFAPFEILERRYIYEKEFGTELKSGFGTGCYHLRRPAA